MCRMHAVHVSACLHIVEVPSVAQITPNEGHEKDKFIWFFPELLKYGNGHKEG